VTARVLQVITGLASGGAETQLRSLIQHSKHRSDVVCLYNPGAVADQLRADGVRVIDLGMRSNRDVTSVARLARLMRQGRYDVVHTHLYRACVYGRLAARLARMPRVVATEHSLQDGQLEGRTATRGVRLLYRATEVLGDVTIAVSAAVETDLRSWGVRPERIVRIPNGLDLDALAFSTETRLRTRAALGLSDTDRVIGGVGRLHPGKQFDHLLEACAPLLRDGCMLLLVGDGPSRSTLEARADELGVAGRVVFVGERPAQPLLAAMDVFASPSPYETFGLAILEALANGLPVVYRRCPALEELAGAVPAATRVGRSTDDLRAGLHAALAGPTSRECPPQVRTYDMRRVSAAVDAVYRGASEPSRAADDAAARWVA
jgi:glycosyltransferase involved in cell wall biosynthesis